MAKEKKNIEGKSKEGKITVKHYLNTRLKPEIEEGVNYYPLYIQVICNKQASQLKSKINAKLSEGYFEQFLADNKVFLEKETSRVENIIREEIKPFESGNSLQDLPAIYNNLTTPLFQCVDEALNKVLQERIKIIGKEDLLRIINWQMKPKYVLDGIKDFIPDLYQEFIATYPKEIWNIERIQIEMQQALNYKLIISSLDFWDGWFQANYITFYKKDNTALMDSITSLLRQEK